MSLPCVILAGGVGSRLRPLTDQLPKTLIPVSGRPFADLQLARLRGQGIEHVVYSIGHLGGLLRDHVGDGRRHGLRVDYVDDGEKLRGTGGAVRRVVDSGLVGDAFYVINGDSYLSGDLGLIEATFARSGLPALMTVYRNEGRWDVSNTIYVDGRVVLYDKTRPPERRAEMRWIDYGLSVLSSEVVARRIEPDAVADLADLMRDLSYEGLLAGFEVSERFYEVGSPAGLRDLEEHLAMETSRPERGQNP